MDVLRIGRRQHTRRADCFCRSSLWALLRRRARAKPLGMSSAGLLRVRGDGGHRYFARAHHAVHLYDTRRHALVEVIRH